ncbi:hypothetical protein H310_10302 [Aphanomyces invadans]|uniref:Uncharacterized protein n=1 Tax=Aphanomyces invadans TaxID=157072 RepID=A0A024TR12_9STRA|nr:hypothetical protein H310_10302 [Aphanomyces invadans]ETV96600.1 hypothetical protein H310_10302 [Aphanomyces invadans]RHY25777.1 hypothetical protein DYB32_008104 [Aphanomyces invadans]|eukprot:XP_008874863.1 hypothetical protein H310_10302 [Aphanomyces invadans]
MSSGWKCIAQPSNGAITAVQLNKDDEVQCLGFNSHDCVYFHTMEDCHSNLNPSETPKPLVCGGMHKNVWGHTGYESASHWCSAGRHHLGNLPATSFLATVEAKKVEVGMGALATCLFAFMALVVVRKYKKSGYQLVK